MNLSRLILLLFRSFLVSIDVISDYTIEPHDGPMSIQRSGGSSRDGREHMTPLCHRSFEMHTATFTLNAESSHALIRIGLIGIHGNVSREYLHRYLWQFDFLRNNRQLNDGECTILAVKAAERKWLRHKVSKTHCGARLH
jgi:hypothetical protein